jgi:acyl-CoA reductase-like NAD-dependent aldehyde dehydrogenase
MIKKVAPKEAINVINESLYGLTASAWIEDATAAERIGSGIGFMNRCDDANPGPDRRQGRWQGC